MSTINGLTVRQASLVAPAWHLLGRLLSNPTVGSPGPSDIVVNVEHLSLMPTGPAPALRLTGANPLLFIGNDLVLVSPAGVGLSADGAAACSVRLQDCMVQVQDGDGAALALANADVSLRNVDILSSTGPCLVQVSCNATLDRVSMIVQPGPSPAGITPVTGINVSGGPSASGGNSGLNLLRSSLRVDYPDATGITIDVGSVVSMHDVDLDVPMGAGFAVEGVAGAQFTYGRVMFSQNNAISSVMATTALSLAPPMPM